MTNEAQKHLKKAKEYIASGDDFYRKAGKEIRAAREAGATWNEVSDTLDRSDEWCRQVAEMPANRTKPDWRRGSHGTTAEVDAAVEKRMSDPEFVAKVVAANPDIAQAVATGMTMADAVTVPEVQMRQAVTRSKHDRMKEIADGIRVVASMDVDEFIRHSNWEYESDHAPSLRTIGRDLDLAVEKLQTLRNRITARLLEIGNPEGRR